MTTRRKIVLALGASALAPLAAFAQQPARIPRVGFLGGGSSVGNADRIGAFRQGLSELGYVEGKTIVIEQRWAEGKLDRLPAMLAELVRLNIDIIVSAGPTVTKVAKDANVAVPVVMGFDDDPVHSGFVASLARPGGSITGLSTLSPGLSGKQLEVLKEIIPKVTRVAAIGSVTHPGTAQSLKEMEVAAKALQLKLQYLDVAEARDFETAFASARKGRADAIIVLTSVVTNTHRKEMVDLAAKNRLPAMYYTAEWVETGGFLAYGASYSELFRRAATYVDKILKGAKPGTLPVEQPTKFELVINMTTAKALGIKVPQSILVRATKVIE